MLGICFGTVVKTKFYSDIKVGKLKHRQDFLYTKSATPYITDSTHKRMFYSASRDGKIDDQPTGVKGILTKTVNITNALFNLPKALVKKNEKRDKNKKKNLAEINRELLKTFQDSKNDPCTVSVFRPKLDYHHRSQDILDIVTALEGLTNEEIFKTSFVRILIDYLWKKNKSFHYQAMLI
jgi:hypothetical protein